MLQNLAGTSAFGLVRYDLSTYLPETLLNFPQSFYGVNPAGTMLRFGQDGLAILSSSINYSTEQTSNSVILLEGPFVTPQLFASNPAPTLTSSTTSITHGAGNTLLTLTGTNLLPGVAVTWNGSYRMTTRVDATHLTIAVPASDLSAAGSVSLVATNPGSSASSALQITMN